METRPIHQAVRVPGFVFAMGALLLIIAACTPGKAGGGKQVSTVQSGEQETVVALGEEATLVIPANTVADGSQVTIQTVNGIKEPEFTGLKALKTYEITIGDQTTFDNPLEIKIKYDPAKLLKDVAVQDQLFAAYLDAASQQWVETDFSLDEAASSVTIRATHLSIWGLFGLDDGTAMSSAPHYRIYFNENLNAPLLTDKPGGADLIYEFAAQIRTGLVDAYDRYNANQGSANTGFKLPEMTNVYVYNGTADDTAVWGWFSKNIQVPNTYYDLAELNQDLAHEVFHTVQNQYVNVTSMNSNRWWIESTADYAAAYIGTSNGLKSVLALDYIKKPIDLIDSNDEQHLYGGAHFIKSMTQQGVDFKDLFEATMAGSGSSLEAVEAYLNSQGLVMGDLYAEFATSFFFGGVPHKPSANGTLTDLADYQEEFRRELGKVSLYVPVPGHYTARMAAFRITDTPGVSFPVYLSALETGSLVQVSYAVVTLDNAYVQMGVLTDGQTEKVEVQDGYHVYFVVTNAGESEGSTTVVIEKPTGVTEYSNAFTSKIYNGYFTADVSFSFSSSVPFEILRELYAPNGETFILDVRLPAGSKGASIAANANVENIRMTEATGHAPMEPSIRETQWTLMGDTIASGGNATYFIPAETTRGLSLQYEVYVDVLYIENSTVGPFGSGVVISVGISP